MAKEQTVVSNEMKTLSIHSEHHFARVLDIGEYFGVTLKKMGFQYRHPVLLADGTEVMWFRLGGKPWNNRLVNANDEDWTSGQSLDGYNLLKEVNDDNHSAVENVLKQLDERNSKRKIVFVVEHAHGYCYRFAGVFEFDSEESHKQGKIISHRVEEEINL